MSKSKKFKGLIISAILLVLVIIFQSQIKPVIREIIPEKAYLRLSWIKNIITGQDFGFYKYEIKLGDQYTDIYDYINNNEFQFSVEQTQNNNLNIFKIPPFFPAISVDEVNSSYIDFYDENIIYVTKNGIFFKLKLEEDKLTFTPIKSNISEFLKKKFIEKNASINYFNPYSVSKFGIKDIFVDKDMLYVSYIESNIDNTYNIGILNSFISDSLNFKKFFSPRNYISSDIKEFSPIQSGGRIVNFKKDSLLFSIGDFRDRSSAQNLNLDNGKIIAISKINSGSRIVSYGHRNPQGLDYSKKFDYVISTEHGPAGGDEINFNIKTDKIKNFGWPISSYGVHYSYNDSRTDSHGGDSLRKIKDAPVYKSHAEYGFVEPIKYFKKNPAVSEIKLVKQDKNYNEFILSTLGYDTIQRPYAQHLIHYSYDIRNKTLKMINKYNLGERVRDTYYDDNKNRIYYVGESTGVLGYINLKSD